MAKLQVHDPGPVSVHRQMASAELVSSRLLHRIPVGAHAASARRRTRLPDRLLLILSMTLAIPLSRAAAEETTPTGYGCYDPGPSAITSVHAETFEGKSTVVVRGEIRGAPLWLGATQLWREDGNLPVRRVTGEFSERFPLLMTEKGPKGSGSVPVPMRFKLWRFKIDAPDCRVDRCELCPKVGYHMESYEDAWSFWVSEAGATRFSESRLESERCKR